MKSYEIKEETAATIRAAAPAVGMTCNDHSTVLHLKPFEAVKFDEFRKKAKIGVDAAVLRILRSLNKG